MASVKLFLVDKNKKVVAEPPHDACFWFLYTYKAYIKEDNPYFFRYTPGGHQKGTADQRNRFWKFLSSLWFFPKLLEGQTLKEIRKDGVFINAHKWNAWEIFCTLSAVRYMDEFDGFQVCWDDYLTQYEGKVNEFQAFILTHWFCKYANGWNSNHLFFYPTPIGVIDKLVPDDFTPFFPDFNGKLYPEWSEYRRTPDKKSCGVSPIFHKAVVKYGTAPNRKPDKASYYDYYGTHGYDSFEEAKHIVMPGTFVVA